MSTIPLVAVGVGNSTIAMGWTAAASTWPPVWSSRSDQENSAFHPRSLAALLPRENADWYVSSVHRRSQRCLAAWVKQERPGDRYRLLSVEDLPLEVDVQQPHAVGMDRLVAALAANRLRHPSRAALVIDAGTAITVDALDRRGCFRGGAILCSPFVAARALATFTDLLPEVEADFRTSPPPIGRSTRNAIRSGLFFGGVGALRELVREIGAELGDDLELIVTGGAARPLVACLQAEYRFVPDLVLAGVLAAAQHLRNGPDE